MAAGVEKDTALDAVLATVGIPWERVLAAGDSPSDLGYVRRAGCGVILGNASAAVRAQAPYVAPPVAEDGLAQAVERWVLN
jgi:hydroxymethylpyrimidine pyrophosphatase-like HAD family hydrolase